MTFPYPDQVPMKHSGWDLLAVEYGNMVFSHLRTGCGYLSKVVPVLLEDLLAEVALLFGVTQWSKFAGIVMVERSWDRAKPKS